jgi:hypothetical protein
MAINVERDGDKIKAELNNGHVAALDKIVNDYKLAGEKEALDFVLSIISQADGNPINNGKGAYLPSERLKKQG